jgi:hypothetical protein
MYNFGSLIFFILTLFYAHTAFLNQKRYNIIKVILTIPSKNSVNNLWFISINFHNCQKTLSNVKVELIGNHIKFDKNYWFKSSKSETDISNHNVFEIKNVFDEDSLTFYLKVDDVHNVNFIEKIKEKKSIKDFIEITSESAKLEHNYFRINKLPDVE